MEYIDTTTNSNQNFDEQFSRKSESISFLAETVWIENTQTLQIIAKAGDINKIKSNGSLTFKEVVNDSGEETVIKKWKLKEKSQGKLPQLAEIENEKVVSFYSKFTWIDKGKTLKMSAPKVIIEQITSDNYLNLEYFVDEGEEKKLLKRYATPFKNNIAEEIDSILATLPLSRNEKAWINLFEFVENKMQDFLPIFLLWIAKNAKFEDLIKLHQHEVIRNLEITKDASTESYYYQNRVGNYWYWYFREKNAEGKYKNYSRGRCKGLNLPKDNDDTIDPAKYRIVFSDDYLIQEINEL